MAPKQSEHIYLEGTHLEGGGQLLRVALGLSCLTRKSVNIVNIRGKRSGGGGLKAQHLTSMLWLGQASNARISGAGLKSKEITFTPNPSPSTNQDITAGHVGISQTTPGSVNLVLQAVLPYLLFSSAQGPIRLRITGGTNVSNSPSYDYIEQVLIPMLSVIGIPAIASTCHSRGWSTGSTCLGTATFTIAPLKTALPAFQLTDRGAITSVRATIIAPKVTEQDFRDNLDLMFEKRLSRIFGDTKEPKTDIKFQDSHHEKRYYLLLVATSSTGMKLGRDWLYDGGVRAGNVDRIVPNMVKKVSDDLLAEIEHGGCVDEWMRDQVVVFQALANGRSCVDGGTRDGRRVQPSLHALTAMWVADKVTGVSFDEEGTCEGVAFSPGAEQEQDDLVEQVGKLEVSG
ncbi:RNA 3'-terminal-phosphate cyclase (ATP) [Ascochyta lentis]